MLSFRGPVFVVCLLLKFICIFSGDVLFLAAVLLLLEIVVEEAASVCAVVLLYEDEISLGSDQALSRRT
jgi:hypothetical protein